MLRSLLLLMLIAAAVTAFRATRAYTPPITGSHGEVLPQSIAALEQVRLGGVDQYILIRGQNRSNPLLLFLHGGPGMPAMYLAHDFQHPLERNFVVIQWDRRGAGKSYNEHLSPESISVAQEISDTVELANLLRARFHQQKIFLVGHSYGSYLGMLVVRSHPELFHAYVGIGQLACSHERNQQLQDAWIKQQAALHNNEEALLQADGKKPMEREKWLFEFGGELHGHKSWISLLLSGLRAPEYSLGDVLRLKSGVNFTARNMKYNVIQGDLMQEVTSVDIPLYFFTGRYDMTDPFQCAEEYIGRIQAPHKEVVWFENSAHFPFLEEPQKFADEMNKVAAMPR